MGKLHKYLNKHIRLCELLIIIIIFGLLLAGTAIFPLPYMAEMPMIQP